MMKCWEHIRIIQSFFQDSKDMKRLLYTIAAAVMLCSCTEEMVSTDCRQSLKLAINVGEMSTKATEAGEDALNENKVSTLDVFMYKTGQTDAKVYKHLALDGETNVDILLNSTELGKLGYTTGNTHSFGLYVIANLPGGVSVTGSETVTELEALGLPKSSSTFESKQASNEIQDNFVMKAQTTATGGTGTDGFTATVELERVASKIGLLVNAVPYDGEIDGVNGTWTPQTGAMTVKFYGAASDGKLGGGYSEQSSDFTSERNVPAAYYTYPTKVEVDCQPYFMIMLPWTNGGTTKNTYYKMLCNNETFESNTFYRFTAEITLAGSLDEPVPVQLQPDNFHYTTAAWQNGIVADRTFQTNAVIKDARYLVVYSTSYTMENIDYIEIPFASSHKCYVEVTDASWWDYSGNDAVSRKLSATQYQGSKTYPTTVEDGYFTLTHTLNNDYLHTDTFDVSPITFTVRIVHDDEKSKSVGDPSIHEQIITVTQNPAITIKGVTNSGGTSNRFYNNSSDASNLGGTYDIGDQTKQNFIISISALAEGSEHILGDPRDYTPWTWPGGTPALASGKDITGGPNRTMQYYYKTRDDGSADNVVAPSFTCSSGYSRCSSYNNDMETMMKRAAVYQENGRPAGRWRLMTKAEAEIVARLNKAGKIPQLLSDSNNFLCARGYINNGTYSYARFNTTGSARLVYDEWYWSQTDYPTCDPITTFTWGDMPR